MTALMSTLLHPESLRIVAALGDRERYRYVQPVVLPAEAGGWHIVSPCCSRNVDPDGGSIDIAWLQPVASSDSLWQLYSRDHKLNQWQAYGPAASLDELLHIICADAQRVFWP